jgi:hypothetical protein
MAIKQQRVQTQLTAPGTTAKLKLTQRVGDKFYKVVLATVDTNIIVRVEYTNTSAGSVTGRGQDITLTANGTYTLPVFPLDNFVYLNFVSETGGTGATVDATLIEL